MTITSSNWPSGTVTFLFTDIEKSTLLWERHREQMRPVVARHDALLRAAVQEHEGLVVKTTGDGLHAVFETAASALAAAFDAQRQLYAGEWAEIAPDMLRVRMGLHTGEAELREGDYYGTAVNRAARIMALGHGGQVLLSAATAALLMDNLPPGVSLRDLGSYSLRGLQRMEHIYQLVAPDLEIDFPPLNAGQAPAGNLPARASSFIGRAREMAEIKKALSRTRLLTLTGPGGTGKTRLSLQLASEVRAEYKHGAWLVELAPVTDPDLVEMSAAVVFDLRSQTSSQIHEMLVDYLREKELLLILDNCEHLITACAQLADDLITACPRLTILASSREGLGVYGETTYHLPTLSLPSGNGETAKTVAQSEAVQLFVERALAVEPGFVLSDANARPVAQIVRRLDGIPLAIELAAARLKVFNVEQVAARLDQRFRLLTGGSRTALPRQQTLRALIDWSYDLLDEDERDLFRRLSVFLGGWTFDAAESIAGSLDIYALLPQLVSKSLVNREADPEPGAGMEGDPPPSRYSYLETIRQYARDRLVESGDVEDARDRHFAYYEALAVSIGFGAGPGMALLGHGQIIVEQDNLRAALEWGIERYPQRAVTIIWNSAPLLTDQMPGSEFIDWTTLALQRLDALPPLTSEAARQLEEARHKGWVTLSMLNLFLGQLDEAHRIATEEIERLRSEDFEPILLATVLFVHAQSSYFLEDPALDESIAEALAFIRTMVDHPVGEQLLAQVLMIAAEAEKRKGYRQLAKSLLQESAEILQKSSNDFLSWAEYTRLLLMLEIGLEPAELRRQFEKTVRMLYQSRNRRMAAMAQSDWAHRMRHEGELDEALAIYQRMLVEWRELGHRAAVANILENIAFVDRAQGRPVRAVTLLGAARRIREEIDQDMLRWEREEYERELDFLRSSLAPPEFDRLWAEGRTLPMDAIITLALQMDSGPG